MAGMPNRVGSNDARLCAHQGQGADGGIHGFGAEGPGQLAQTVRQDFDQIRCRGHVVLVRGHFAALAGNPHPGSGLKDVSAPAVRPR